MTAESRAGALSGLRVIEFAVFAAGPLVGKHLAEHGAEVIRVESLQSLDGFRVHYPPFKDNRPGIERGGSYALFNDQVLNVTLDLKKPKALELARRLIAQSDIVIENFAHGVMDRLGLGYDKLCEEKPDIIMLSSCNQGQTGRRAAQRGFGSQLTSMSGFTHVSGYGGDQPPMLLFGPYVDFVAVGFGLIGVLAALDHRRRTGKGHHIDLSQCESGIQFVAPLLLDAQVNGRVHTPQGNRDPHAAPHGAYRCKGEDEWCVIAVFGDDEWQAFCRVSEHPDWASDPRFATHDARKLHEDEIDGAVGGWTCRYAAADIFHRLQSAGVRAGIVQSVADLFSCPQLLHRKQWRTLDHAEFGAFEYEAPPFTLSETPAELCRPSPLLGEHNEYVFGEILGLRSDEIRKLTDDGIIM